MTAITRNFVTVVSGLPRSGTSMMMRMLDVGGIRALVDGVRRSDEDNPMGYYELEAVKRTKKDSAWLGAARGRAVKMVHLLLLDLPPVYSYRVLFMHRALDEVVRSQDAMLERKGRATHDLSRDVLTRAFVEQVESVEAWVSAQPNFALLHADYNRLMTDPAPELHAVNAFLGGGLDTKEMAKIVDPTLYRHRCGPAESRLHALPRAVVDTPP